MAEVVGVVTKVTESFLEINQVSRVGIGDHWGLGVIRLVCFDHF